MARRSAGVWAWMVKNAASRSRRWAGWSSAMARPPVAVTRAVAARTARSSARARSLNLAVRAATALVVTTGGRAMSADHPGQRLLREAAFFTIQAQTPAVRQATLDQLRS